MIFRADQILSLQPVVIVQIKHVQDDLMRNLMNIALVLAVRSNAMTSLHLAQANMLQAAQIALWIEQDVHRGRIAVE